MLSPSKKIDSSDVIYLSTTTKCITTFHTKVGPFKKVIDCKKDQKARLLYIETDAARKYLPTITTQTMTSNQKLLSKSRHLIAAATKERPLLSLSV